MGRSSALTLLALISTTIALPAPQCGALFPLPWPAPCQIPAPTPTPDASSEPNVYPAPYPQPLPETTPSPLEESRPEPTSPPAGVPATTCGNGVIRVLLRRTNLGQSLTSAGFQQIQVPGGTFFVRPSPDVIIQPPPILVRPKPLSPIIPPPITVQPPQNPPVTPPVMVVRPSRIPPITPPTITVRPPPLRPIQPPPIVVKVPQQPPIQPPPIKINQPPLRPIAPPFLIRPSPGVIQPSITLTSDFFSRGKVFDGKPPSDAWPPGNPSSPVAPCEPRSAWVPGTTYATPEPEPRERSNLRAASDECGASESCALNDVNGHSALFEPWTPRVSFNPSPTCAACSHAAKPSYGFP